MAIPMPIVQDIRRLDQQGLSRAEIARRLHVDRAVAKYADMEDLSPRRPDDRRYGSKIDGLAAVVDGWLEANRRMPRKQRHTARRVYDRLVSEHGWEGSYSVVQRYVKRWRETNREPSAAFLDLSWAPGVMQVDFGVAVLLQCLFANRNWGSIFLGVLDDGSVEGMDGRRVVEVQRNLVNRVCNPNQFSPSPAVETEEVRLDGRLTVRAAYRRIIARVGKGTLKADRRGHSTRYNPA